MRRATRMLSRVKHDYTIPNHHGYLCPICEKNRLTTAHKYPICTHCRQNWRVDDEFLDKLKAFEFQTDQDEIVWDLRTIPTLTGRINKKEWKAVFCYSPEMKRECWSIWRFEGDGLSEEEVKLLRDYWKLITNSWIERLKQKRVKIRRVGLILSLGTGTLVTIHYLRQRKERLEQEKQNQAYNDQPH